MHLFIRRTPLGLRYVDPVEGANGGGSGDTPPVDSGFPANTPVAEMTDAQAAAYWKYHSRKHEAVAKSREDYDTVKQERDTLKTATQTDADKAIENARTEGEKAGSTRFLADAVAGHLRGATGRTADEIAAALEFVDTTKFVKDGALDTARIDAFAATLGTGTPQEPAGQSGLLGAAASRSTGQQQQKRNSGGSIKDRVKARQAELTTSKTA